jgi:hypothetical protein
MRFEITASQTGDFDRRTAFATPVSARRSMRHRRRITAIDSSTVRRAMTNARLNSTGVDFSQ